METAVTLTTKFQFKNKYEFSEKGFERRGKDFEKTVERRRTKETDF